MQNITYYTPHNMQNMLNYLSLYAISMDILCMTKKELPLLGTGIYLFSHIQPGFFILISLLLDSSPRKLHGRESKDFMAGVSSRRGGSGSIFHAGALKKEGEMLIFCTQFATANFKHMPFLVLVPPRVKSRFLFFKGNFKYPPTSLRPELYGSPWKKFLLLKEHGAPSALSVLPVENSVILCMHLISIERRYPVPRSG